MAMEKVYASKGHSARIMSSISQLWHNKKYCDAVLQIGSRKLEFHRLILVVNSPSISKASCTKDDGRKLTVRLHLDKTYEAAANLCLNFLYEGAVILTDNNVDKVKELARRLYLKELVNFCDDFLELRNGPEETSQTKVKEDTDLDKPIFPHPLCSALGSQKSEMLNTQLEDSVTTSIRMRESDDKPTVDMNSKIESPILDSSDPCVRDNSDEDTDDYYDKLAVKQYVENFKSISPDLDESGFKEEQSFSDETNNSEPIKPKQQSNSDKPDKRITKLKRPMYSPLDKKKKRRSSSRKDKKSAANLANTGDSSTTVSKEADTKSQNGTDALINLGNENMTEEELIELKEKLYPNLWREFSKEGSKACNICGKVYHSYNGYWKHIRKHLGKSKFECTICGKGCCDKNTLDGHMNKHAAIQPYYCPYCPKQFSYRHSMARHIRFCPEAAAYSQTGNGSSQSKESDKSQGREKASEHNDMKETAKEVTNHENDDEVVESSTRPRKRKGKNYKAICHICGKHLLSGNGLHRHMMKHEGIFKYTCEICGRGFMDKVHFEGHVNAHSKIKAYSCPKCKMKFTFFTSCRKHTLVCTKTEFSYIKKKEKHLCVYCGAAFNRKENLNEHARAKHSVGTANMVTCGACGKAWKWKSNRNKHLRNTPECRRIVNMLKDRTKHFKTTKFDDNSRATEVHVPTAEVTMNKDDLSYAYPIPGPIQGPIHGHSDIVYDNRQREPEIQHNTGVIYDTREQMHQFRGNVFPSFDSRELVHHQGGLETEDEVINYAKEIMKLTATGHGLI